MAWRNVSPNLFTHLVYGVCNLVKYENITIPLANLVHKNWTMVSCIIHIDIMKKLLHTELIRMTYVWRYNIDRFYKAAPGSQPWHFMVNSREQTLRQRFCFFAPSKCSSQSWRPLVQSWLLIGWAAQGSVHSTPEWKLFVRLTDG